MNRALLRNLRRCVPEFAADDLFLDLPYVVFGEFAQFTIERLRTFGSDDPVVKRAFECVNDLFVGGDRETVNMIETTLFEMLADDSGLARAGKTMLEPSARASLERMEEWVGRKDTPHR